MKDDDLRIQNDWSLREEDLWRLRRSDGIEMTPIGAVLPTNHDEIYEEWLIMYDCCHSDSIPEQNSIYDDFIVISDFIVIDDFIAN